MDMTTRRPVIRRRDERGAAMVEFAMILPLLVLLTFGIIEFGVAFNASSSVSQASRAGGRTAAIFSTDPQLEFNAGLAAANAARRQPQQHHRQSDDLCEQVRRGRRPVHRSVLDADSRGPFRRCGQPDVDDHISERSRRRDPCGQRQLAGRESELRLPPEATPTTASWCACRSTTTFSFPASSSSSSATTPRRRSPPTPSSSSSRSRRTNAAPRERCSGSQLRRTRRGARLACHHTGSPPRRNRVQHRRRVLARHEEPRATCRRRGRARRRRDVPG